MPTYKGSFCWHGEDHLLYTVARSPAQAFQQCCRQLAKKLEYSASAVVLYFKYSPSKYKITEELSS
jgi:hypothetical protein